MKKPRRQRPPRRLALPAAQISIARVMRIEQGFLAVRAQCGVPGVKKLGRRFHSASSSPTMARM